MHSSTESIMKDLASALAEVLEGKYHVERYHPRPQDQNQGFRPFIYIAHQTGEPDKETTAVLVAVEQLSLEERTQDPIIQVYIADKYSQYLKLIDGHLQALTKLAHAINSRIVYLTQENKWSRK